MARRDDDALSWGDDDPTLDTGVAARDDESEDRPTASEPAPRTSDAAAAPASLPEGYTAIGRGSDTVATDAPAPERASLSNVGLLALGVLGGVYLLFAAGWLVGGLRVQAVSGFLVASNGVASPLWTTGNLIAVWLAVLAGPIWFAVVLWMTASGRPWLRWVLLVVGAILFVPWPFVMVGAVGA